MTSRSLSTEPHVGSGIFSAGSSPNRASRTVHGECGQTISRTYRTSQSTKATSVRYAITPMPAILAMRFSRAVSSTNGTAGISSSSGSVGSATGGSDSTCAASRYGLTREVYAQSAGGGR